MLHSQPTFNLTRFMKATREDPLYIKGWGRLAVSEQVGAPIFRSVEATIKHFPRTWRTGNSPSWRTKWRWGSCPPKKMGPGEMKLMKQYSAGLEASREKQSSKDIPAMAYAMMSRMRLANEGEMPWDCAKKLTSSSSVGSNSSVRSCSLLLIYLAQLLDFVQAWVVREANQVRVAIGFLSHTFAYFDIEIQRVLERT